MEARDVRWRGFKDKDGDDGLLDRRNYSGHMELSERQIFFFFFFFYVARFFKILRAASRLLIPLTVAQSTIQLSALWKCLAGENVRR